ncbi:MAG: SHOCT domain-containing protein [Deltaproteobacteria bacterium]|nr:SHOCT domain-containing protein [Deltaproteobacteria bacterium]
MIPGAMMTGWGAGFGLFGGLMMLLFWILIIAGIVLLVRWFINEGKLKGSRTEETPLDILKKRYAGGEINKEQYESMKQELT